MPEGNEIHRFALRHATAFAGRRVQVDSPNGGFAHADLLDRRMLRGVEAYGKHLGYFFGRDLILHVHLGMYGDFREGQMPYPAAKGALRLRMWTKTDWIELRGPTDCSIFNEERWKALLQRLGPDPLREDSDPAPAFALIERRATPIGALLMDQSVLAGIGNIYRAELLFRARLHPFRPGSAVSASQRKGLWTEAKKLMRNGMVDRRIVTTRPADRSHRSRPVHDEDVHYVYRRQGRPCRVCSVKIESRQIAGRTVYWCPQCQKD
ncbi:Fpg/Nei family DNA glycosylase [Acidipila rosea]|uniref:DNA-(apurinic or apyrimidinic site) lyase n=1 Tax=Acidipila rosea TaxID=768535 RepID=A0A4R1LEU9_9BACT|nr:DNA-formamidopyrimidine glycosylase family protein [Acidipila rosea]TCK75373.1 endonuclease-8 [Acidipila rosea]